MKIHDDDMGCMYIRRQRLLIDLCDIQLNRIKYLYTTATVECLQQRIWYTDINENLMHPSISLAH